MYPKFRARPDHEISMMAEIGVSAAQDALVRAGKQAPDVDGLICAAARAILVVNPEITSPHLAWKDRHRRRRPSHPG